MHRKTSKNKHHPLQRNKINDAIDAANLFILEHREKGWPQRIYNIR
ncbi:MAG: hypothetical protein K2P98_05885 [Neisseriaceae bacterium]|nr:hypothetical protein [Neisseriaceae bacterium]